MTLTVDRDRLKSSELFEGVAIRVSVFAPDASGGVVDFERFRGKVVYAVNVASC